MAKAPPTLGPRLVWAAIRLINKRLERIEATVAHLEADQLRVYKLCYEQREMSERLRQELLTQRAELADLSKRWKVPGTRTW